MLYLYSVLYVNVFIGLNNNVCFHVGKCEVILYGFLQQTFIAECLCLLFTWNCVLLTPSNRNVNGLIFMLKPEQKNNIQQGSIERVENSEIESSELFSRDNGICNGINLPRKRLFSFLGCHLIINKYQKLLSCRINCIFCYSIYFLFSWCLFCSFYL